MKDSTSIPNAVIDSGLDGLPGWTLVQLARHADSSGLVKLSRKEMATTFGVSPPTLDRRLRALVEAGLLKVTDHGFRGAEYRIIWG